MRDETVAKMDALIAGADAELRSLTVEEVAQYQQLETELNQINKTEELRSRQAAWKSVSTPVINASTPVDDSEVRAFEQAVKFGNIAELRAQSKGTDTAGGFLVPDVWRSRIVEKEKAYGGFLDNVERITTSGGEKMLWPTLDDTANVAGITAENAQFAPGADLVFGEASLDVYKYTSNGAGNLPLKVSVELMQDSAYSVESLIEKAFTTRIRRKQASDALVGTGTNMPKGILDGTPDIALASGNAWTYDKALAIEGALDPAYRANAKWLMSSSAFTALRGMVDDNGRPLLMDGEGIGGRIAPRLLGYEVILDNSAPAQTGDAVNFAAFGDFRQAYVWRTVRGIFVIADPYSYSNNGQVGFVAYERAGGTVQDRNAYVLVSTFNTP